MATTLRGRAAQPIRPGFLIHEILAGTKPLIAPGATKGEVSEQVVSEACMTDLHFTYKALIGRENQTRPRHTQLRGMTTESFAKLFRFAKYMGLVEFVRDEDMISPPSGLPLLHIVGRSGITESKRKIYRLSELGTAEEVAWGDLRKAWQEKWEMPRKMEVPPEVEALEALPEEVETVEAVEEAVAVIVPAEPRVPRVPKAPAVTKEKGIPAVSFGEKPSTRQFNLMLRHLRVLEKVGVDDPIVKVELAKRTENIPGNWQISLEDMIEVEKDPGKLATYQVWIDVMMPLYESLTDRDLGTAIGILEGLIG